MIDREPHNCSFCGELSWQCEALLGGKAICLECKNAPRDLSEFADWLDDDTIEKLKLAAERICKT